MRAGRGRSLVAAAAVVLGVLGGAAPALPGHVDDA
jgi:hypothetical protein